jgi:hypothetical protein
MINVSGGTLFKDQTVVIFEENEDCFGNILGLAMYFGWEDTHGNATTGWTADDADNCEEDALFFLDSKDVWLFVKTDEGDLKQLT